MDNSIIHTLDARAFLSFVGKYPELVGTKDNGLAALAESKLKLFPFRR